MLEDEDKFDKAIHVVMAVGIPLIAIVGLMMTSGDDTAKAPVAEPEAAEIAAPANAEQPVKAAAKTDKALVAQAAAVDKR